MYTTTASLILEKNKSQNSTPIYLYAIELDAPPHLYYTSFNETVSFFKPGTAVAQNYTPFPITHDQVETNTKGEISGVKLTVTNVGRYIIQLLLANDALRGHKVTILLVFSDSLGDYSNCLKDEYYIDSAQVDENNAVFSLTTKFIVDKVSVPSRVYRRDQCSWSFKGIECASLTPPTIIHTAAYNTATNCNKTLLRCTELGNNSRAGMFPSIPSRSVFF